MVDQVVVPPANASTTGFVTTHTDGHHRHGGDHHHHNHMPHIHRDDDHVKNASYLAGTTHILGEIGATGRNIISDIGDTGRGITSDISTSSRDIVTNVGAHGRENERATRQVGHDVEKSVTDTGDVLQTGIRQTQVDVERTSGFNRHANDVAFKTLEHHNDVAFKGLHIDMEKGFCKVEKTTEMMRWQLEQRVLDQTNILQLQAERNAAAAALAACTNTAAIQKAIAECCCETKELIRAEAGQTRDLVNSIQKDSLMQQLAAAHSENNLLKIKVALPTIPV